MELPEDVTVEWLQWRKAGDKSNGEQLACWAALQSVEPKVLERWLLSTPKGEKTPMSWILEGDSNQTICEMPWEKFNPKRWTKQVAQLKATQIPSQNLEDFIEKVEKWKEFKGREGVKM